MSIAPPAEAVPSETSASASSAELLVVVSKGQSRKPEKRGLETAIAQRASKLPGVEVLVIPHLYDLPKDSQSFQTLRDFGGDLVVVSWIFERATHWVLDRNQIRGRLDAAEGESIVERASGERADHDPSDDGTTDRDSESDEARGPRVTELYPRPQRRIRCIDLKQS
ncbi:MAG: hypothetical protein AAF958_18475, partial [Planctomycetota bacterium]